MQRLTSAWSSLDTRRQITAIVAALGVFAGVLLLSRLATQPGYQLLYSGLEPAAAGEVVGALERENVAFKVRGGAIYVEAGRRDELRMTLASEGLPANGGKGYELLDSLSGFGTTAQMFDAAYWRAKEGELARTIVSAPYIGQARVHIANTGTNPFQRTVEPSASVSVTAAGAQVTASQAEALRHLVASAVAGLSPDNVTVIDGAGNLVGREGAVAGATTATSRAAELRARVTRLLEARVGRGNVFVEVSLDTVTATETVRERRLDPAGRVAVSTDTEERADNSSTSKTGVSVSSNLPDGDAGGDGTVEKASRTRERVNYEVSETEREIHRGPGQVRRMTVAVLVNDLASDNATGARSDEELKALRELTESAVGFDEARGDVITIKSMPLQQVSPLGTAASNAWYDRINIDVMTLAQMAILGLVLVLLGLFVIRPILKGRPQTLALPALPEPVDGSGTTPVAGTRSGPVATDDETVATTEIVPALPSTPEISAPVERLRAMIGDRQEETVEILRGWLEDKKEDA